MDLIRMRQEIEKNQTSKMAQIRGEFNRLNEEVRDAINSIDDKIAQQVAVQMLDVLSKIDAALKKFERGINNSEVRHVANS